MLPKKGNVFPDTVITGTVGGDPLYRRVDLAPVTGPPGAFQYLAHVQKRAE